MLFASTFDIGLIPFYVFAAYIAYTEYANHAYNWGTMLGDSSGIPHVIANILFILSIVNGALHAISFGISMFLGTIFRQITRLPPDLNPLEDNLTARPHKRSKSELAEKHNSHSTLDSGIGMDDPLMGTPHPAPFTMHNRGESYGDDMDRFGFTYENRQSQGPCIHPDQLPYVDAPPRLPEIPFQPQVDQPRNPIPRKPLSSQVPVQNTDIQLQPTSPMHLEVPHRGPSINTLDRNRSVSPMSDNWIAYPSRSPSPLENLVKENGPKESTPRRDTSSMYSRSNTTASTNSAVKDWMTSAQRYGWDVGETITEDVRGEYESIAMHEFYGNDDEMLDYPQQNEPYDKREQDLGDQAIEIYTDQNDLDDIDDDNDNDNDNDLSASHPLNPLGMNPLTPQISQNDLPNGTTHPPATGRLALADIPNLSPSPNLRPESPPAADPAGDSPMKKTGRSYGDLKRNPSVPKHRNISGQAKPSSKKSKQAKQNRSKKMSSYGALRQDDQGSDDENENDLDNENDLAPTDENDRKGRVVSNSGADVMNPRRSNVGTNSNSNAGLSSYGSYIAGLGVGFGRRRDVSGKMAEEGRSGTMVNAGRPGTEPEHKTAIRAAGWARFAGL